MYMRPGISFWKGGTELFSFRARGRQAIRWINLGDLDFLAAEGGEGNIWKSWSKELIQGTEGECAHQQLCKTYLE